MAGRTVRSSSSGASSSDDGTPKPRSARGRAASSDAARTTDAGAGTNGRSSVEGGAPRARRRSVSSRTTAVAAASAKASSKNKTTSTKKTTSTSTKRTSRSVRSASSAADTSVSRGRVARSSSHASSATGEHRFPIGAKDARVVTPRVAMSDGATHSAANDMSAANGAAARAGDGARRDTRRPPLLTRVRAMLPGRAKSTQTPTVRRTRIVEEPVGASAPGAFVDANNMRSEDIVAKTLRQTAGSVGVATRPKIVDFTKRQKERKRANIRQVATRVGIVVASFAVVIALVWLLFFSPVLRLNPDKISVSGANQWVSREQIMTIARGQAGKSLLLVSDGNVERQLSQIPGVSSAQATKKFPNGFDVHVEAQRPAAMLRVKGGDILTAVDAKARVLNAVDAKAASGIPVIDVQSVDGAVGGRAIKTAVVILDAFPEAWRKDVTGVNAPTQDSITTTFANGITVVWGDDADLKLKMAIVDKIMNDPNVIGDKKQINVSAPNRPIIK